MIYCKDCKFFKREYYPYNSTNFVYSCIHTMNIVQDPVFGKKASFMSPYELRSLPYEIVNKDSIFIKCGPDAKWFEKEDNNL